MIFFFLCPLTLAVAVRTEDSFLQLLAKSEHHITPAGKKKKLSSIARQRERWDFKVRTRRQDVPLVPTIPSGVACGESLDLRTWMLRCTQSDRGPHLFYSPQRLIQRHERYVRSLGARFESRCYILLFFSFFVILLCGARCTSGWHYGNSVQKLWNSWNSLFCNSNTCLYHVG